MADPNPRIDRPAIRWLLPAGALGSILLANALFTPGFFDITIANAQLQGSTVDILTRGSILVIVAIGMTLVIATGGVDLSVGAVVAIAGAATAVTVNAGHTAFVAIIFALSLAAVAGGFNGVLVAGARIQPIVATLILMVAGRGVAQLITHGQTVDFDDPVLAFLDEGTFGLIPMPVILALAMLGVTIVITRTTAIGLFIEAVGDNETASRLAGVRTRVVKLLAYTLCGLGAGVAGILAAADVRAADANNAGFYLELDAILAVVIGGTPLIGGRFTLVGTVLGALFIQTLTTTLLRHDVNDNATLVVKAIVVIGVCLMLSERFRALARATLLRHVKREATA
jgi:simple sugar transport system permease protein